MRASLLLAFYVSQSPAAATPLIAACGENHPQVVSYLISKGAKVNYQQKVIHCLYCFVDWFINRSSPHSKATRLSM